MYTHTKSILTRRVLTFYIFLYFLGNYKYLTSDCRKTYIESFEAYKLEEILPLKLEYIMSHLGEIQNSLKCWYLPNVNFVNKNLTGCTKYKI